MKNKFNINKRIFFLSKINYLFSTKNSLLFFLLVIMAAIVSGISGVQSRNVFEKLYFILTDRLFNALLFLSLIINVLNIINLRLKNYEMTLRTKNILTFFKEIERDVNLSNHYSWVIIYLLALSSSIVFSMGNINMINHPNYEINIIIYLAVRMLITFIISKEIMNIICIMLFRYNKNIIKIFGLIFSCVFFVLPSLNVKSIKSIFLILCLPHYFFIDVVFETFMLEISSALILIFVLKASYIYLKKKLLKVKRDLIL